jgi:predicted Zn finger-like uncharacterized protein
MFIRSPYLFKKGDAVICPSCRKTVFVKEDVLIYKERKLVKCSKCGAYVRWENLQVNNSEVKE